MKVHKDMHVAYVPTLAVLPYEACANTRDLVVFAHLQCGIDPRTSGRIDCDVIDVNSTPDESTEEHSYFHVHRSHL